MMNFAQEGEKGYCSNEEDQEDEEVMKESTTIMFPFSSSSHSPSSSSSKYKSFVPQHQKQWLGTFSNSQEEDYNKSQEASINFDNDKKLDLMDLSLGNNNTNDRHHHQEPDSSTCGDNRINIVEKEHMFDKVVTPSDVGKLNRLVIPKQHAEKYFPLDSSSNEKGLLLNFEDRNGKPWRFRYSYWNSSQSYVMTKGWSRFVKEKKLDAGDIVSFQRGMGESGKDRLYIDWRRRSEAPDPTSISTIQIQNHLLAQSMNWGGRLYSSLPPSVVSFQRNYEHLQQLNYSRLYPYHHQQQQHQPQVIGHGNYAAAARYYLTSPSGPVQIGAVQEGVVIDSVPVVHGKTAAKRLRLFGVNMECATQEESPDTLIPSSSPSSVSPLQSRLSTSGSSMAATMQAGYSGKGKSSSLSFDVDL